MKFMYVILNIGWVISVIVAVLISAEIIPPLEPIDLSVMLLCTMGLVFASLSAFTNRGEEDGEDQSKD